MKRQRNCRRSEIRAIEVISVTPGLTGFPAARLAGRLETRVKRNGKRTREVVYLLSDRTLEELQAEGMLELKRNYWVIESRLHHCLDITMREDASRVRTPNSARVLGMIRRVALSLANAAVDLAKKANPKTKSNTKSFHQSFRTSHGGSERLHALVFAKKPAIIGL